ncbi:hypothetical protein GGU11DRAFT_836395 [Lentinula aff. detonsa]|uniref:Uncharacterized protein n=1 Tax=Lentinula aff. detonsa TaxID=2804958 RepID=A0AA38L238_9AGAR|nr:hypothetical protein GGU10DRAFT_382557 [Lentinula aff. detonsa]KAJ3791325.1 hypothetical protein GGU11DRAFT_836395 [Lentinula aff. detonsa]
MLSFTANRAGRCDFGQLQLFWSSVQRQLLVDPTNSGGCVSGINIVAYKATQDSSNDPDVAAILSNSNRPTLISLNRFEKKNNVALAVEAFARIRAQEPDSTNLRLVLGGSTFIVIRQMS